MSADESLQHAEGAVADMRAEVSDFTAAAADGQFRISPEAADAAARVCIRQAQRWNDFAQECWQLARRLPLGDFAEGRALAEKFTDKAQGGAGSAQQILEDGRDVYANLAANFQKIAGSYRGAEELNRTIMGAGGGS